ncbi:hypothetical protein BDV93DRAFT_529378 [Ceratobasidium sp. AG-I]|nr:hypothetical protein BDV93DRAFT_529378 [Ceratobasidium sp. AG-I]
MYYSRVPTRSAHGCLTCKQRRKKCDEAKPHCKRCTHGGYLCLGYKHLQVPGTFSEGIPNVVAGSTAVIEQPHRTGYMAENIAFLLGSVSPRNISTRSSDRVDATIIDLGSFFASQVLPGRPSTIPKSISPESAMTSEATALIMSNCLRIARDSLFRPFPIEEGIACRVRDSAVTRWTMFLMAKVAQALCSHGQRQKHLEWVNLFYQQIKDSSSLEIEVPELAIRLAGLHDLHFCVVALLGNAKGYSMFKANTPIFIQLAICYPTIWSRSFEISIYNTLRDGEFSLRQFVFYDTMLALAFSVPPLINYDTTPGLAELDGRFALEWVYGCPSHIVVLIAKINAWRTQGSTLHEDANQGWEDIEKMLQDWRPNVDPVDEAPDFIGRLAVHECWRHATLIYLYMGMCNINSADPRVHSSVRQIVQLVSTIETESHLKQHVLMPCLVAGAAARHEKHRAVLRSNIVLSKDERVWILRGDGFVPVLDHLWHGAGSNGRPTTWDDYANSRRVALPIDT